MTDVTNPPTEVTLGASPITLRERLALRMAEPLGSRSAHKDPVTSVCSTWTPTARSTGSANSENRERLPNWALLDTCHG